MAAPSAINLSGLHSGRPAAGTHGLWYYETDTGSLFYDNGSAWLGPISPPVFVASGASHASGAVPDPGAGAGTTHFLREDATWAVPAGGGGSGALTLISTQTLAAAAASVTFSSIAGTYRSLKLLINASSSAAANFVICGIQFNGDTGANYDSQRTDAHGTTVDAAETIGGTSFNLLGIAGTTSPANSCGVITLDIPGYAATVFRKTFTAENFVKTSDVTGGQNRITGGGEWRSTAAITSIVLTPASGNFIIGSTFSLYGVS